MALRRTGFLRWRSRAASFLALRPGASPSTVSNPRPPVGADRGECSAVTRAVRFFLAGALAAAPLGAPLGALPQGEDPLEEARMTLDVPRVLFLTHSAGFVHDVVRRPDPSTLSFAESALSAAASGQFELVCTQDCAELEGEHLARYAAVVFYTTGELPLSEAGKRALQDWIAHGGALVGIHCATDTFYEVPWYGALIGGRFDGHPWHEEVELVVEDARHPAVSHLAPGFTIAKSTGAAASVWTRSTSSCSALLWKQSRLAPRRAASAFSRSSMAGSVTSPYQPGSRRPSRLRFGPLMTRIRGMLRRIQPDNAGFVQKKRLMRL